MGRILECHPGKINLKRVIELNEADANDHIFELSPDGIILNGYCPQSGCRWQLTKMVAPAMQPPLFRDWVVKHIVGVWQVDSGNEYFGGQQRRIIVNCDLSFSGHGNGQLKDGLV